MKKTNLLMYVTTFYGVVIMFLFILSPLVYLPPLNVDDFLVNSKGNIVVVSSFQNRLFFISEHGKIVDSIKIPESKGTALMAIDNSDNIYINRLNSVEVFALNKKRRLYSVDVNITNDWILDQDGTVTNFNRSRTFEYSHCPQRNRRVIQPGGVLFGDSKCPPVTPAAVFDDFVFDGKVYRCNTLFKNEISVYDIQGHLLDNVKIIPWYLMAFSLPFPAMFILALMGLVSWILIRKSDNKSVPLGK